MTAINTFKFGEFFLRPAGEQDRALAERWTAADPDHAGVIDPNFWLENKLGRDGFLLSDASGPVFFFKMHIYSRFTLPAPKKLVLDNGKVAALDEEERNLLNVVQVFIQFPPWDYDCGPDLRLTLRGRVSKGLAEGCEWLERTVQPMGATELFFDSKNESLIRFCVNRLGFRRDGDNLRKKLTI
jgi:hypothetical protein